MTEAYQKVVRNRKSFQIYQRHIGSPGTSTFSGFSWTDQVDGVKNARWRDQIKSGQGATTPAIGIKQTVSAKDGAWAWRVRSNTNGAIIHDSEISGCLSKPSSDLTYNTLTSYLSAEQKASAKFVRKANAEIQRLQALVTGGEFRSTLRMILSRGTQFRRGISSYFTTLQRRRRRGMSRPDLKKVVSDTYLEYAFGWRQLWADIAGAHKALDSLGGGWRTAFVSAQAESDADRFPIFGHQGAYVQGLLTVPLYVKDTAVAQCRINGMVRLQERNSLARLHDEFGVGLRDFIPAAYNLLPYTWIVDSFTNLGEIIDSACFRSSYLAWTNKTLRYERESVWTTGSPIFAGLPVNQVYLTQQSRPSVVVHRLVRWARSSGGPVVRTLEFRIPGFDVPNSWLNLSAFMSSQTFRWRHY